MGWEGDRENSGKPRFNAYEKNSGYDSQELLLSRRT